MSTELIPSRSTDERDIHRAFDKWHKKHLYADRENAARVWQAAAEYYGRAPAKPVEAPPTDVKPLAHGHRDDYYLMANARNIAGHSIAEINRMPNCVFARNLFGTGSTSAHQICIDAGIDPDGLKVERASTGKHGGGVGMRTNREKYEHYCAEIAAKDAAAISALVTAVPAQFYEIRSFEALPVEVTHLGVYRRGIYKHDASDRITKGEVEQAAQYAAEWVEPTLDSIQVHYRRQESYGTVTGAHPYSKIGADANMAWLAEDLAAEIDRRRALYAPRDGHKPCNYCRKQTPEASLISATIWYRDRGGSKTKVGQYCSGKCAGNDQCGHEG